MSSPTTSTKKKYGSGGVSVLYKKELHESACCAVYVDTNKKEGALGNYNTCLFEVESPYLLLYDDIIKLVAMGDIKLLGDFNAEPRVNKQLCLTPARLRTERLWPKKLVYVENQTQLM